MSLNHFLRSFIPSESTTPWSEKFLSASLVFFSIIVIVWVGQIAFIYDISQSLLVFTSIGASAILVFAVPHGKLSQPWPVIGSHLIASIVGITCAKLIPDLVMAAGLSVSISALLMYLLRCLHPPGGGTALAVVFATPEMLGLGYSFVINPVLVDCFLLIILGVIFNNYIPNRYYPYALKPAHQQKKQAFNTNTQLISQSDISDALEKMGIYVDISKAELAHIFAIASDIAQQKKLGVLLCQDIMSQPVISVEYGEDVENVWQLLSEHKIRALPVVDKYQRLQGIITIADFLNQLEVDGKQKLVYKLKQFIKRTGDITTDKLEFAGHLMVKEVITLKESQSVEEALGVIYKTQKRHFPVINEEGLLVGMITSRNIFKALDPDITDPNITIQ